MNLSIIIVNYNTTLYLRSCLESLIRYNKIINTEYIVVDNNSPERSIETFPTLFPEVNFFFRKINDGFGAGCNYGASQASGKNLMFVNPDIVFETDIVSIMSDYISDHREVGACSPVFINFDDELVYTYNKFPNFKWEFFEFLGKGNNKFESRLLENEKITSMSEEPLIVDWATGACLIIRANVFHEVGGFDDTYFLYYEDTDLQRRISDLGYKIICLTKIRVKHFVNSSIRSDEGEDIYYYHFNRSKFIYIYKHFGFFKRNIFRFLHISGVVFRMTALNFRRRYSEKRDKKMKQYIKILGIFLSSKGRLYKN